MYFKLLVISRNQLAWITVTRRPFSDDSRARGCPTWLSLKKRRRAPPWPRGSAPRHRAFPGNRRQKSAETSGAVERRLLCCEATDRRNAFKGRRRIHRRYRGPGQKRVGPYTRHQLCDRVSNDRHAVDLRGALAGTRSQSGPGLSRDGRAKRFSRF